MNKNSFISEKEKLLENLESIFDEPFRFCISYSSLVEKYVREISGNLPETIAILSTGSFARRELSPSSDIDIMFLIEDENSSEIIKKIISRLWEKGIEASHTLRTFSDIDKFFNEDLHSFTQFFETRYIAGNSSFYLRWKEHVKSKIAGENKSKIVSNLIEEVNLKNNKYGNSPKVLQPNIKYSAGGLRDIHLAEWIYIVENSEFLDTQKEITQTQNFLKILANDNDIGKYESDRITESYKFILGLRNVLHIINNTGKDRLNFRMQEKLAELLPYYSGSWQKLMNDYFSASTSINRFLRTILKKCKTKENQALSEVLSIEIDENLKIFDSTIYCNENCDLSIEAIVRTFYYRGKYNAILSPSLRTRIIEKLESQKTSYKPSFASTPFFREIFNLEKNIGKTLRAMNEIGLLGILIPEFQDLIGYMQPGVYHAYTADEHTLIAIEKLEELSYKHNYLAKIFHHIDEKDTLFLATFFHDIGKPVNIDGHEIIGADIADAIMSRMGFDSKKIEDVKFLVRYHLTMEQTAFRRNLNDPVILDQFASIFPTVNLLEYLYLLTYADLSAVNPRVWTQWKSELLFELFDKTRKILTEKISAEELLSDRKNKLKRKILKGKKPEINEHLSLIDDLSYVETFSKEEIEAHVNEIKKGEKVSVLLKDAGNYTNVTVITQDAKNLLSRLCGAFALSNANIHDAKIFTRADGIVIDTFNVSDFISNKKIEEEKFPEIKEKIIRAVFRQLLIAKEFKIIRSRWKRFEKKFLRRKKKPEINFIEHENFTIIDIHTTDRLGLLYKITQTLNQLNIDVYYAKIVTHGENVIDSFYTLMNSKTKIPTDYYELIRFELTETIEKFLKD